MSGRLAASVRDIAARLDGVYALDLDIDPEDFLVSLPPERAQEWLPSGCRSGLVLVEEADEIQVGMHLDPRDHDDAGTVVEETSHLVCLAWHAAQDLPVSLLVLELQAEVDRFVLPRLRREPDAMTHFEAFRWADGLEPAALERYEVAHQRAHRYCRSLERRFPAHSDTPGLLGELRRFYRASPETKLSAAA